MAKPDLHADFPRYDTSIYDTSFAKLPNPKRVWLGTPSSALEGRGLFSSLNLYYTSPDISRSTFPSHPGSCLRSCNFRDQDREKGWVGMGYDEAGILAVWEAEVRPQYHSPGGSRW